MITKAQMRNAERINGLANIFGHLPYNSAGQTPCSVLDLSIPCARLVVAGVVTGVDKETNDGITDWAVREVENKCRLAVAYVTETQGEGWWSEDAKRYLA
jgi:hypothetical protein